jgi:hypothetical protein
VRRIGEDIVAGFAGSTADCFTLMERLERKLEEHPGQLTRACVDLAKAWRTDKYLRRLEVGCGGGGAGEATADARESCTHACIVRVCACTW